jgi:hypothetical protein
MTDVMRVRSAAKQALVPGAWVRMRRNDVYKDDLGQVCNRRSTPRLLPSPSKRNEQRPVSFRLFF